MRLATLRFLFGSVILLLVDILWVASSEITEYLYHEKNYGKPFFTAYLKSVMFIIYLFGFLFLDSWWYSCKNTTGRVSDYYSSINDFDQQSLTYDEDDDDNSGDNDIKLSDDVTYDELNDSSPENVSINCTIDDIELSNAASSAIVATSPFISESIWLPMKHNSDTSSLSGKSETDDEECSVISDGAVTIESFIDSNQHSTDTLIQSDQKIFLIRNSNVNFKKKNKKIRRSKNRKLSQDGDTSTDDVKVNPKRTVRFSKLIEVRQLSDKHAEDAFLSRLSYSAFMRVIYQRNQRNLNNEMNGNVRRSLLNNDFVYRGPKLSMKETALLAFYFTSIWFAANLSFHLGLQYSEAGFVNVLSSTTPLFTLLLGIIFPSFSTTDSVSLTKLLGVLICISSVAVISSSEPINHSHSNQALQSSKIKLTDSVIPLGGIWSLCGAFFYALYVVLMKFNVAHDSMLNLPMFFGFIGLFSMILMWPIILLLNFTQLEIFQWPNYEQWILILVNGLCGTVISELLWLWGSFMTSSLVGTIAVSFTIPFSVFFDIYFKGIEYPAVFFLGTIPMFFSFITIIFVSQYENFDPVLSLIEKFVRQIRDCFNDPVLFPDSLHHNINDSNNINSANNYEPCEPVTTDNSADNDDIDDHITPVDSLIEVQKKNSKFYHRFLPSSSGGGGAGGVGETSTNISTGNNRRFDGTKTYRQLKDSMPGSSTLSSARNYSFNKRFEDDDQEQCQALIDDDNAYA